MPARATALALVQLARPLNAAMAAWAVLIGAAVAVPIWGYQEFPWGSALLAMSAAFLVLAYGNVANDLADRAIDEQAHPERPLPSGRISTGVAAAFAAILANLGLLCALLAGGGFLLLFAFVNAVLLLLYNVGLKRLPVAGNLVVAWLVASAFLFGAMASNTHANAPREWGSLVGFAVMAFFATVARENAKGLQDAEHDEGRFTLARLSPPLAQAIVIGATLVAVGLAAWMVFNVAHPWWLDRPITWDGIGSDAPIGRFGLHDAALFWWRYGVAASIPVFLVGAGFVWRDPARSQRWLKAGMLVAMLGYSWAALQSFQGN